MISSGAYLEYTMTAPVVGTDHEYEYPLYGGVSLYLSDRFTREHGITIDRGRYFVDDAWRYNSGDALGPFSRPDFVGVTMHRLRYQATSIVELHAFQVKRYRPDIKHALTGALEAAYYQKWAHYSYLVMHYPSEEREKASYHDVVNECTKSGVGLIVFDDADHMDSFHMYLRPVVSNPYPPNTERFIANRVTEGGRLKIDGWHAS
jgi:hypothetical protein